MFACKVCKEKDSRLADQAKQIEFLKRMLSPNPHVPMITMEADKVLEGGGGEVLEFVEPSEEQAKLQKETEDEFIRIVSGTY